MRGGEGRVDTVAMVVRGRVDCCYGNGREGGHCWYGNGREGGHCCYGNEGVDTVAMVIGGWTLLLW